MWLLSMAPTQLGICLPWKVTKASRYSASLSENLTHSGVRLSTMAFVFFVNDTTHRRFGNTKLICNSVLINPLTKEIRFLPLKSFLIYDQSTSLVGELCKRWPREPKACNKFSFSSSICNTSFSHQCIYHFLLTFGGFLSYFLYASPSLCNIFNRMVFTKKDISEKVVSFLK